MTTTDTLSREQVDGMIAALDIPELRGADARVDELDAKLDGLAADAALADDPEERAEIRRQIIAARSERRDARQRRKAIRKDARSAVAALHGRRVHVRPETISTELISIRERRLMAAVYGPADHVHAAPTSKLTQVPGEASAPVPATPAATTDDDDVYAFFEARAERRAKRKSWWATLFGRDTAPRGVTPCGAWMPRSQARCILARGHAGDHRAVR